MSTPLEVIIGDCETEYWDARDKLDNLGHKLNDAGQHLIQGQPVDAGIDLKSAGSYAVTLSNVLHSYHPYYHWYILEAIQWISDNWPSATMSNILDAMWDANAIEYHHFVGYIDAYRANMWNLPFYTDWHTLLVRHFSQ